MACIVDKVLNVLRLPVVPLALVWKVLLAIRSLVGCVSQMSVQPVILVLSLVYALEVVARNAVKEWFVVLELPVTRTRISVFVIRSSSATQTSSACLVSTENIINYQQVFV
jgi:hypothetical protein